MISQDEVWCSLSLVLEHLKLLIVCLDLGLQGWHNSLGHPELQLSEIWIAPFSDSNRFLCVFYSLSTITSLSSVAMGGMEKLSISFEPKNACCPGASHQWEVEWLENSLEGDKEKGNQGDSRVTKLSAHWTGIYEKWYLCKQIPLN